MMSTDNFNILDVIIANWRFRKLRKYIDKKDIILDFGCGYQAFFLQNIASSIKFGIGIDAYIRRRNIAKNIRLLKYKFINHLQFKSNYFNKVFMLAVLEHIELPKIYTLFKEIFRVLKPTGMLILTTPTPESKNLLEFLAFKLHLISKDEIGDHKKYYGKKDIDYIAAQTGFKMVDYKTFIWGLNSLCMLKKRTEYDETY